MSPQRPAVAVIGAGGLARAFSRALGRSGGADVVVAARRPAQARAIARGVRGVRAAGVDEAVAAADIVLLAVPDGAIAAVARELARHRASWRGVVVLHAAGAYGPAPLAPLAARGAAVGVLHPFAVLGRGSSRIAAGSMARIEGTPKARSAARRLASLAGLTVLAGRALSTPRGRKAYHAAASLASNDVIALLVAARDLLVGTGVSERNALRALSALAGGALAQAQAFGLEAAVTGPVARGDVGTVTAQLAALGATDEAAAEAHRALSLRLVTFARAIGRLDSAKAEALRSRLARGRGRAATV